MATGFAFDFEKCTECRRCMIACAQVKTGAVRMADSRIEIVRSWPELPQIRVCRFDDCDGHPCVDACPFHAIRMNGEAAWKCDFCGGDPECVKACVTVAIARKGA